MSAAAELRTPRLKLRSLQLADAEFLNAMRSDARVAHSLKRDAGESPEETRQLVQRILDDVSADRLRFWLIERLTDSEPVGSITLWFWSHGHFRAEAGYMIDARHWNNGYATESLGAAVDYGFGPMNLHRIEARTLAENTASRRTLEKAGFALEGLLVDEHFHAGRFHDSVIYARLNRNGIYGIPGLIQLK